MEEILEKIEKILERNFGVEGTVVLIDDLRIGINNDLETEKWVNFLNKR